MSLVTIVIPYYKQADFLSEAIESAQNQKYFLQEIIVVNDADPTIDKGSLTGWPGVTVIHHTENKGLAAARNTGIAAAETEWVLPLDADDKISPWYLFKAITRAAETKADIVTSWLQTFGDYEKIRKPQMPITYMALREANRLNCCSLFRKSMWEKLGGYDEHPILRYGREDHDFWIRAANAKFKFACVDEVMFYYRKHGQSLIDNARAHEQEINAYLDSKYNDGIKTTL